MRIRNEGAQYSLFGDFAVLLFLTMQGLDGTFTYIGVTLYGIGIELNPLIVSLLGTLGHGPALIVVKAVAAGLGIWLYFQRVHVAVAFLAALCFAVAVFPGILIFFL